MYEITCILQLQTTWLLNGFQMLILFLTWRMTAYLRCNIKRYSTYKIIQFIIRNVIKVIADGISNSVLLLLKVMGEIPWIRATSTHRNPSSLSILIWVSVIVYLGLPFLPVRFIDVERLGEKCCPSISKSAWRLRTLIATRIFPIVPIKISNYQSIMDLSFLVLFSPGNQHLKSNEQPYCL